MVISSLGRKSRIGFIGAGTVGGTLSVALCHKGYSVVSVSSRNISSAQALAERVPGCVVRPTFQKTVNDSDVVFISTSDDAIESVVSSVSWCHGQSVIHCSGALSLDVLDYAVQQGAISGTFHPFQAFSSVDIGVKSIPGITFGIEGNSKMTAYLEEMAVLLEGNPISVDSKDKVLYHLTGVMMGGLLTTLGATTARLWECFGVNRAKALKALVPIMRQVSYNLESFGIPGAVAGPYARGDIGTVRKHLKALQDRAPEVLPLYCEMALIGIPFALEKGTIKPDTAEEIRELVNKFKDLNR